ncbi:MAG TPA: hypothetical protein VFU11_06885 [Solirubrobacterales bacterium]|nr:hypothetical protein [Solirubrobacterales bacterium]
MSSVFGHSFKRPAILAICLIYACIALAGLFASEANAGLYRMVLCAGNNGSNSYQTQTNTTSAQTPNGIFSFENYCVPAPFPAGNNAYLRIAENQSGGSAGYGAYGRMSWSVPQDIIIAGAGGYTREPNAFNDGWRGRFWVEGYDGSENNSLVQGAGVENGSCGGVCWATTSTFASHLWPFGGYGNYRRFVFELTCFRPAGCDRTNYNAVDANTMILTLNDNDPSHVSLTNTGAGFLGGAWSKGTQAVTYKWTEHGSGIRFERVRVDGGERFSIDHIAANQCNRDARDGVGEFARNFNACPTADNINRSFDLDTTGLSDGTHTLQACTQDYSQWQGLNGSGGESCDERQVRTDNSPPAAPGGLSIVSSNPARYLDHFRAHWTLPDDPGSPIAKVHYNVVDAAGVEVMPAKTLVATNPTSLDDVVGPAAAGDYRLRVWLEDEVGFIGPVASVPIPHDTTPPASPQELSVTPPATPRVAQGFDVRWHNIVDAGSPIDVAHYQVLSPAGDVVVPTQTLGGSDIETIPDLETPRARGRYTLRLWLEDAEGNVGAATTAPLAFECVRSDIDGGAVLSSGLGEEGMPAEIVSQGEGSVLHGRLTGAAGAVAEAPVCVFARVVTKDARDFLGLAVTAPDGGYRFAIPAGASRELTAAYRSGSREVSDRATIQTIVHPTFKVYKKVVRNKSSAKFLGNIPGPENNNVVVVLQVKRGKGWLAFRRYRTREGGRFTVPYRFNKTNVATKYLMRVQVRNQSGYPYLQGNSDKLTLIVLPRKARRVAHPPGVRPRPTRTSHH